VPKGLTAGSANILLHYQRNIKNFRRKLFSIAVFTVAQKDSTAGSVNSLLHYQQNIKIVASIPTKYNKFCFHHFLRYPFHGSAKELNCRDHKKFLTSKNGVTIICVPVNTAADIPQPITRLVSLGLSIFFPDEIVNPFTLYRVDDGSN
jgi:hypothetical protein